MWGQGLGILTGHATLGFSPMTLSGEMVAYTYVATCQSSLITVILSVQRLSAVCSLFLSLSPTSRFASPSFENQYDVFYEVHFGTTFYYPSPSYGILSGLLPSVDHLC